MLPEPGNLRFRRSRRARSRRRYEHGRNRAQHEHDQPDPDRPQVGAIPLGALLFAHRGVDAIELEPVARHLVRLHVLHPGVREAVVLGVVAPDPRRVLARDLQHPVDDLLPLRAVRDVLHPLEEAVVLRVLVVGGVLAAGLRARLRAVQQEHEVLGVRVVRVPAEEEELGVAGADLFLEPVPVARAQLELDVELLELPAVPVEPRLVAGAALNGVEVEHERLPGLRVAPVGVARLREELLRDLDRLAHRPAVHPVVHHRVDARLPLAVAEDPRRDRSHARDAAAVLEDRDELLPVDRDRDRLAELARALGEPADHRVEEVEREVERAGADGGPQLDPALLHLRREARLAFEVDAHRLVEVVGADPRLVVVALQELVPVRDALLLAREDDPVDERRRLAGVGEEPRLAVARLARRRIRLAAEMRVALEDHPGVRVVLGEHVRPGADRPPVEREVAPLVHAALRIELVRLHRQRREERHREPVHELRILALDPHAVGVAVDDLDPGEREAAQIDPRQALVALAELRLVLLHQTGVLGLERVRELLQPDDVLAHVAEDRRVHARVREPLDLVDVVLGGELARAGLREVRERELALDLVLGKVEIERLPARVDGERRVRLIADPRPDADLVLGERHGRRRRIGRKLLPRSVEQPGPRHLERGLRHELVGPLEVVVLERRLVDLLDEAPFVGGVGARRIERLRPVDERAVEEVLSAIGGRIGIVPFRSAARDGGGERDGEERGPGLHGAGV